jgi:hypothetical protein
MRATRVIVVALAAAVVACTVGVLAGSSGFGVASAEIMWTIRAPRFLPASAPARRFAAGACNC